MKKLRYYLITLLAMLFLPLFFSGDSFAVSDVTYTIDNTNYNQFDLCNSSCSTYNYVYIHDINMPSNNEVIIRMNTKGLLNDPRIILDFYKNNPITDILYHVPLTDNYLTISGGSSSGTWSFKVTLSENNPTAPSCSEPSGSLNITENGTYDVTNYASAVVNVPTETTVTELPPYSELVVDSFWKYHVAIAGGLASIFAIFVVYRIIKSRLR